MAITRHEYEILGAAFDLGYRRRGGAQAPQALRERHLLARLKKLEAQGVRVHDGGDVTGPTEGSPDTTPLNLPQAIAYAGLLMPALEKIYQRRRVPVVLGGDHSISVPSVSAAARWLRASHGEQAELGLVWVDAHPDLETPEASETGDLHAMPVAHLLGYGHQGLNSLAGDRPALKPENVAMVGLRDVVDCEREIIERDKISVFSATDVERLGIVEVCKRSITAVAERTDGFVLSFDIDACDPSFTPGVHFPERAGLTFREALVLTECVARTPGLMCLEMVEVVPELDREHATSRAAITLLWSALGGTLV